jgi:hypothetical protein
VQIINLDGREAPWADDPDRLEVRDCAGRPIHWLIGNALIVGPWMGFHFSLWIAGSALLAFNLWMSLCVLLRAGNPVVVIARSKIMLRIFSSAGTTPFFSLIPRRDLFVELNSGEIEKVLFHRIEFLLPGVAHKPHRTFLELVLPKTAETGLLNEMRALAVGRGDTWLLACGESGHFFVTWYRSYPLTRPSA